MPSLGDMTGRYAPSPTSDLHVGNLRTAMVAWLCARAAGEPLRLRIEDLDTGRVRPGIAERQLADLDALGITFDGPVMIQSERADAYHEALASLETYPCFCTRREIAEASSAPHDGVRRYPGTCRDLTDAERAERARERPASLRVRADGTTCTVHDRLHGEVTGVVDDFVLRRADGAWAYNLAVVVDDIAQGVDEVVRGDDLLGSAPRQAWLTERLGAEPPTYVHVGLVVDDEGTRLAKRHGAVTLADLAAGGEDAGRVRARLGASLGLCDADAEVSMDDLLERFDPTTIPTEPWVWPGARSGHSAP